MTSIFLLEVLGQRNLDQCASFSCATKKPQPRMPMRYVYDINFGE